MSNKCGVVPVIEISSSSSDEGDEEGAGCDDASPSSEKTKYEEIDDKDDEERKGSGVSPNFSIEIEVKTLDEKRRDEDDCCILDFDLFKSVAIDLKNKLSISNGDQEDDLSIVSAKGQVACRDYPHSRHLCAEYPFNKTPHESYCPQCYCYVCDVIAPCRNWRSYLFAHCHASDKKPLWKDLRKFRLEMKPSLVPK